MIPRAWEDIPHLFIFFIFIYFYFYSILLHLPSTRISISLHMIEIHTRDVLNPPQIHHARVNELWIFDSVGVKNYWKDTFHFFQRMTYSTVMSSHGTHTPHTSVRLLITVILCTQMFFALNPSFPTRRRKRLGTAPALALPHAKGASSSMHPGVPFDAHPTDMKTFPLGTPTPNTSYQDSLSNFKGLLRCHNQHQKFSWDGALN